MVTGARQHRALIGSPPRSIWIEAGRSIEGHKSTLWGCDRRESSMTTVAASRRAEGPPERSAEWRERAGRLYEELRRPARAMIRRAFRGAFEAVRLRRRGGSDRAAVRSRRANEPRRRRWRRSALRVALNLGRWLSGKAASE